MHPLEPCTPEFLNVDLVVNVAGDARFDGDGNLDLAARSSTETPCTLRQRVRGQVAVAVAVKVHDHDHVQDYDHASDYVDGFRLPLRAAGLVSHQTVN